MVKNRSVAMVIILSLITCGIYSLYWMYAITEELSYLTGDRSFSGGKVVVFTIITFGIYSYFWYFNVGKRIAEAQRKQQKSVKDDGVIYLILAIVGLSLVSNAIIQSEMNYFT